MKQDEIIEMARQAGFRVADQFAAAGTEEDMVAFAKLVAAKEQDRICRQIAVLHDSIMLASHATLKKKGEA